MSTRRHSLLAALTLGLGSLLSSTASLAADGPVKIVYHMSEGIAQAARGLGNIRNHLAADPTAKIVVVAHGAGIDFLIDGAEAAPGKPFAGNISEMANRGVEFRVCNNTLVARNIPADKLVMESKIVPSGVAEIGRLQAREGFVYLKP